MLWTTLALAAPGQATTVESSLGREEHGLLEGVQDRDTVDAKVVGGEQAASGAYPDAVGIVFYDAIVGCTGTLIAPNVVVTAAHCIEDGTTTGVLIGSTDWWSLEGEAIDVIGQWMHPSYSWWGELEGRDIAVLLLESDSTYTPRQMAIGCASGAVEDGMGASIVGYGRTDAEGDDRSNTKLNHAETLIRDTDCSEDVLDGIETGCIADIRPGGEIIAGGRLDLDGDGASDGAVDACFGDSGGPLYAQTPYGELLVGVTSRSMDGVDYDYPCRDGGIWVRPDAVLDWIEESTGVTIEPPTCNLVPEVESAVIEVEAGRSTSVRLSIEDPDSRNHTLEVLEGTTLGITRVSGRRVQFEARDEVGTDVVLVRVTDDGGEVEGGVPASTVVEIEVRVLERTCGCQTGPSGAWWGLLALPAFAFRRRSA